MSNHPKTVQIPHVATLTHASKLSLELDKPILQDYYLDSIMKRCKLVKTQEKDTILFKNNEEYTSPLKKVLQIDASTTASGKDIICISENSIYIVHSNILSK
jgi:hypothetical protein